MKKNMGMVDRVSRIIFALIIGFLYFTNAIEGTVALLLGIFALAFLVVGFIGFCPLYSIFGFNTNKDSQ